MQITLVQGDITTQRVDAIVNAANSTLFGGGGVDGAIHRAGGPAILAECRTLRASRYPDGLPVGQAVATMAGMLPARWVIHTVGPIHARGEDRSDLLASCYRESVRVAAGLGARSVAFPAISAGAFAWPAADAARIAITTVLALGSTGPGPGSGLGSGSGPGSGYGPGTSAALPAEIRFVLFEADVYQAFDRALAAASRPGVSHDHGPFGAHSASSGP